MAEVNKGKNLINQVANSPLNQSTQSTYCKDPFYKLTYFQRGKPLRRQDMQGYDFTQYYQKSV